MTKLHKKAISNEIVGFVQQLGRIGYFEHLLYLESYCGGHPIPIYPPPVVPEERSPL